MQQTQVTVGGAVTGIAGVAVQLTATSQKLVKGVKIQALSGNTAPVYVGPAGVTTMTGFPIAAGVVSEYIAEIDPSNLYLISTGGTQEIRWLAN